MEFLCIFLMKAVVFAVFTCSAVEAPHCVLSPCLGLSSGTSIDGIVTACNIAGAFCKEQEAI